jgi:hypothetical protein
MTRSISAILMIGLTIALSGQMTNFSGTWALNPSRSTNLGVMAAMEDIVTIGQTPTRLTLTDRARVQGQESTRELHYDLTGQPVTNPGPMGDQNETVAKWAANKLVVTWTSEGAVAGTKVVRTETRSLSADGKTMTVESVRATNAPIVMVFDKR